MKTCFKFNVIWSWPGPASPAPASSPSRAATAANFPAFTWTYISDVLDHAVCRAVRVGNRDVENFSDNDAARFLDNTWKLLPESNPALHSPMVYTVRDYRIALQKMEVDGHIETQRVGRARCDKPRTLLR